MSAIVDFSYYSDVYRGTEASAATFPALSARALDIIGALTRWAITETTITDYPEHTQTMYRKAVCAQVDFFAVNGLDSINVAAGADSGFTVGKVSVHGRNGAAAGGRMSSNIAPMAVMYLEQSGLLCPAVPVVGDAPVVGWW